MFSRIKNYTKETVDELQYKVSWPTWEDLQRSAMTVLVASIIIAAMIWAMDFASGQVLGEYYNLFKSN